MQAFGVKYFEQHTATVLDTAKYGGINVLCIDAERCYNIMFAGYPARLRYRDSVSRIKQVCKEWFASHDIADFPLVKVSHLRKNTKKHLDAVDAYGGIYVKRGDALYMIFSRELTTAYEFQIFELSRSFREFRPIVKKNAQ